MAVNSQADKHHATRVSSVSPKGGVSPSVARPAYASGANATSSPILPMGAKALQKRAAKVLSLDSDPTQAP